MNKQLYENTEQIDIDELFDDKPEGVDTGDPDAAQRRAERRKSSAAKKRKRNMMIANAMIYGGIGIFIISCVIIGYFIYISNRGIDITSLSFPKDSISTRAGRSVDMNAVTKPDGVNYIVTYTVSDNGVAEISTAGILTAKAAGTVTVTASSGNLSAVCTVTVVPDTISALTVTAESIVLEGGETKNIGLNCYPADAMDKNIVWSTSDSSVAVVDENGVIKGVDSGDAVVTVTDTVTGIEKSIKVTVVSVEAPEDMHFNESELTVEVGDTYEAKIIFTPDSISDKSVIFSVDNEEIAEISDKGVVTAKSEGSCVITCTYENVPSITCTLKLTVIDPFIIVSR